MVIREHHLYEIVSYFKKNLKKGYPQGTLVQALVNQGYAKIPIEKGLAIARDELANEAPKLNTKPVIKREIVGPRIEFDKKPFWKKFFG
ncbi:hypothetical protein CO038_04105 [Candidatus Pacearchaeota archaeon CG_4_9_14_0_2_um_filter_39_13]|nr:MAG: hypothetical protein AUJ64_00460 [Candidatus Pacearchaeota archaeon CG1_02_39_14]PJC44368.1 MAG: hypothetical protein CO038_04105 [Candidatus Pacearchaeota archaeon CG_4_9_14_0_2_um_filter_39_13]